MADLTPRKPTVPVRATRTAGGLPLPPDVIEVPRGAAPTPAAGGPQNVIYVVAAPPPPAAAGPPVEVHHHHHHTTEVVAPVRRRRLSKGVSFLGTLAFVVGGLACGLAYGRAVPGVGPVVRFTPLLAEAGLAMGAVAWVGAVLFRRVGAGMPSLGVLVSAAGYLLGLYATGQAQAKFDWLRVRSPVPIPAWQVPTPPAAPTPANPAAPAPTDTDAPPTPTAAPPPHAPTAPPKPIGSGTIFDTNGPGWVKASTRP